jgi:hypothetical protein
MVTTILPVININNKPTEQTKKKSKADIMKVCLEVSPKNPLALDRLLFFLGVRFGGGALSSASNSSRKEDESCMSRKSSTMVCLLPMGVCI